jgi:hypothetical protein
MKSVLSIALTICVIGSAFPVTAQEKMATAGPLARAVEREAARFRGGVQRQPGDAAWSRVRELDPGAEIVVTVKGSPPGQRYFIAGDESTLTVLNAAVPGISSAAREVLIVTAADHPIYFVLAQQGKTFPLNGNIHLTQDGLLVSDQKVAELEQIVVHIARDTIAEISLRERHVGKMTGWGAAIGGGAGFVAGLIAGTRTCRTGNCDNFPPIAVGMIYSMFGGGIGSGVGAVVGAIRGKTQDVLYRAQ